MGILKTFLGHCLLSRPLSHGRPIIIKRHARVFYTMLNYQNKTSIKLISLILAQVFLLTGVVYPESTSNKNTSSIYIKAKDLRVPMMGSGDAERLKAVAEILQARDTFLKSGDIRTLAPLLMLVRTGDVTAISAARDIVASSKDNRMRYRLLKELNFNDRKNIPAARQAIESLTSILGTIAAESEDDWLVSESLRGLISSSKNNFQPATKVIYSLIPKLKDVVLYPIKGTSDTMPQALEALTYSVHNGNPDAIESAKEIFLRSYNTSIKYRALESLTLSAKQGNELAVKAIEELLPHLNDIILSSSDELLIMQILDALSFAFQIKLPLAAETITGFLSRLKGQIIDSQDDKQKILAIKILDLAFRKHLPLVNNTVEILAPRMTNMILESQNDQLAQSSLGVLLAAASNNSQAANEVLKELSRILIGRSAGLKTEGESKLVLKNILKAAGIKIKFNIYEISSARAAKGLVESMGWDEDMVVIGYSKEMDESSTRKEFSKVVYEDGRRTEVCGYKLEAFETDDSSTYLCLEFHDDAGIPTVNGKNYYNISYNPFKFGSISRISEQETQIIRKELNVGNGKVIVLASPSDEELKSVLDIYDKLQGDRPLLIVAPRHRVDDIKNPSPALNELLGRPDTKRRVTKDKEDLLSFPDMQGYNVLMLDTMGELMTMYSLADVSIIGEDRNIVEPASQAKPVLYFEGEWRNNKEVRDLFVANGAIRIFTEDNLIKLLNGEQSSISMVEKELDAVSQIREKPLAEAANDFSSRILPVVLLMAIDKKKHEGETTSLASNNNIRPLKIFNGFEKFVNFRTASDLFEKLVPGFDIKRDESFRHVISLLLAAKEALRIPDEPSKAMSSYYRYPTNCGPCSVRASKILKSRGLKAEVRTIEFSKENFPDLTIDRHSFVITEIAGRQFIVDMAADQFEPTGENQWADLGIVLLPVDIAEQNPEKFWMYVDRNVPKKLNDLIQLNEQSRAIGAGL